MAVCPETNGLTRGACLLALGAALCFPGLAQLRLPLEQLGARKPPNFTPVHDGQTVVVRGVVSARAFHFPDHSLLAFEDSRGGAVIEVPLDSRAVNGYQPGDEIEVQGTVSSRAGMVTILPSEIRSLGHKAAPAPRDLPLDDLVGFPHLGQLVRTEGRVAGIFETTGGVYLTISSRKGDYKFFVPHALGIPSPSLAGFSKGDKVEAAGVAHQYCTTAPYDHWFELLVGDTSQLIRTERSGALSPLSVAIGLAALLVIGFVFWNREHRLRWQRERLRKTYQLGEEILSVSSIEAMLTGIAEGLPRIL